MDATILSLNELNNIVYFERFYQYRDRMPLRGEISCAMSHRNALIEFLQSDAEFALIFEDDINFDPNLMRKLLSAILVNRTD